MQLHRDRVQTLQGALDGCAAQAREYQEALREARAAPLKQCTESGPAVANGAAR